MGNKLRRNIWRVEIIGPEAELSRRPGGVDEVGNEENCETKDTCFSFS